MARSTLVLFFSLSTIAALLIGIRIGQTVSKNSQTLGLQSDQQTPPTITPFSEPKATDWPIRTTPSLSLQPTHTPTQPTSNDPTKSRLAEGGQRQTTISNDTSIKTTNGETVFSDRGCGFSFSLKSSSVKQETTNGRTILTIGDDPNTRVATTCASDIPEPPVTNKESITLDGISATLYHDASPDGSPRDEFIAKHPTSGTEIIVAGYGSVFQQIVNSFAFLR